MMRDILSLLIQCLRKASVIISKTADLLAQRKEYPLLFSNCSMTAKIKKSGIHFKEGVDLAVGHHSIIEGDVFFEKENASLRVGDRTFIGASIFSCAEKIQIGNDVLIAFGVVIADHDSHAIDFAHRQNDVRLWHEGKKDWTHVKTAPVIVGDKAWIGMNALILEGVTVGEGAIIGAGAVVTRDVPQWTLVAGNPARVIRALDLRESTEHACK
ncbi:MAG: acyltransferase [Candidatus Accumulibacter sp.]|jgi:acetyltransferase-like isoleucine patch superfamily enzyme|nr:acyltransferase [Accumulibacter sp.]